jgi:hypothetical protein
MKRAAKILCLSIPLRSVLVSIARIKDILVHTLELCRNNEVEVRNGLRRSLVDLVIEDTVDDTTCIADRDTLASTVPTSVDEVSLSTALLHVANELLSILCRMQLQECLAEASRECRSRLCDTTLCTSQLSCEAREEVVLRLLSVQDRNRRQHTEGISAQEDNLLCCRTLALRTLDVLDVVDRIETRVFSVTLLSAKSILPSLSTVTFSSRASRVIAP